MGGRRGRTRLRYVLCELLSRSDLRSGQEVAPSTKHLGIQHNFDPGIDEVPRAHPTDGNVDKLENAGLLDDAPEEVTRILKGGMEADYGDAIGGGTEILLRFEKRIDPPEVGGTTYAKKKKNIHKL